MRPPSTALGLALILFVVAVLPLGALATVSVDAIQERAAAHQRAEAENTALAGAVCVATLMEAGASPRDALARASCAGIGGFLLAPGGERTGPDGPLPGDPALAELVGARASGTTPSEGGYLAWARVPGENLVLVTRFAPSGMDAAAMWGVPLHGWGTAALVVGVGLIALALTRRWVSVPLAELARASERVAQGRWRERERAPEGGTREIVALARSFNSMADQVAEKQRRLTEANARLDALAQAREEQLAHAVEQLEAYSFTVDHELREPLRSLETLMGVVLDGSGDGLTEDARDLFDTVRRRTGRLETISQDLLRYDDVGREEHAMGEVDLGAVVEEAAARVAGAVEARGGRVERPEALPRVRGNRELLVALFAELLENAMTYNDAASPLARVRLHGEGDGAVVVAVEDNGIGVPADRREEVFHLFQRLHPVGTYSEGTGVGLALARRVARVHDGDVAVDAAPGGGSRFVVTLPVRGPAPRPALPAPATVREF